MVSVDRAAVVWTIGIVAFATGIAALGDELAGPPGTTDTAPAPQAPPETTGTTPAPQAPAEPAISANPVIAAESDSSTIPRDIASSNNDFAIDFYRAILEEEEGENIFFSPPSMYVAFSVLYEGARENTASQIQDVFGLEPDEAARHNSTAHMMASINRDDPDATLDMANALWLADGFAPYDSYVDIARGVYLADTETVSFTDPDDGIKKINDWAAEKTNGTIDEVITPAAVDALTEMVITNAVYFKGTWVTEFPEEDTTKREFWTDSDQSVEADFMVLRSYLGSALGPDGAKVLKMPYKGDRLSMLVILPAERDGLAALEETISAQQVQRWLDSMRFGEVVVIMPKFEMETNYDLIPPLETLGMTDVFDGGLANLGGIAPVGPGTNLYVDGATQDAYVKVNEEGTEASAVTTLSLLRESGPGPLRFAADHPFLFTIYDEQSGMILFMGRVSDPTS